ncbi:MAG TPA: AgmX/PglI C-terminal domain-containing protein [Steroidobacteraceae bacterium]|nr:AgmX/PglI C-terminal domain-containing protein [Steroidobacteraceae bacterium]
MIIAPYYREYELPWEGDPESSERFRKILRVLLVILVVLGILFPLLPTPQREVAQDIPTRLAKVMLENKPKPPPPPPPKPAEQPKIEPKVAMVKQPPPPVDLKELARRKAERQLNKVRDELADLREQMDLTPLQTKNLTAAVGADSHAERSLITSKVGAGSGGITSANASRGFGTGAGSLTGHTATAVTSSVALASAANRNVHSGGGGKPARSPEEIALVFDRNKGRIYNLYARALRENAELQGKLVLEFTIAPNGTVTMCRVVSSELKDPELEQKIIALVRLFQFQPEDVDAVTATKPIDFFPTSA